MQVAKFISVTNILVAVDIQVVSFSNANKQENHSRDVLIAVHPNAAWVYKKSHFKRIETLDNNTQKIITGISEIDLHQYSLMVFLLFLVMV